MIFAVYSLYYVPSPSRLAERFSFIESLTLKGLPDKDMFPHKSNIDVAPWIEEIAVKFKGLKSLHIRNLAIHDSDLELLSRTRGRDLKVLKIHKCEGFSEIGLMYTSKSCNELRTFILDDVILHNAKDGKWLHEFALRKTAIETFYLSHYHYPFDAKDVVHLVKNYNMEHVPQYGSFKFPATIRCLGIYDPSKSSAPFVLLISNQLRELNLHGSEDEADCQCFLIARCPNLEVLRTKDACGDRGMQVISRFCTKLRKLEFCNPSGATCMGLIAVAKGCCNLEFLYVYLTDISNEALKCTMEDNLKNLRDFHMYLCERENCMETNLPLDNGIRAMLIGMYGVNLRYLFLERIGGSDEGLRALSMGCPRLRKLEMKSCDFSEQAVASIVFKINTLRYVLLLNDEGDVLLALTRPNFGDSTMETQQVLAELEPYVTLAEKLDKLAVAAGLLRAMIAKRVGMSVKRVILDGSSEKPVKSIQVQIAEVEFFCFADAISEFWNIIVEGLLKNGVPRLTRVGAFEVNASLKGNIILCVVDPEIVGSFKSLLIETNLQGSFTRLSRTVGKQALRVIVVDKKPRLKTLKKIHECPGVKQVLCVAL
ncbi:leucine-rich repeat, cysteine-containing subtype protein [Tanacetum coccineum]